VNVGSFARCVADISLRAASTYTRFSGRRASHARRSLASMDHGGEFTWFLARALGCSMTTTPECVKRSVPGRLAAAEHRRAGRGRHVLYCACAGNSRVRHDRARRRGWPERGRRQWPRPANSSKTVNGFLHLPALRKAVEAEVASTAVTPQEYTGAGTSSVWLRLRRARHFGGQLVPSWYCLDIRMTRGLRLLSADIGHYDDDHAGADTSNPSANQAFRQGPAGKGQNFPPKRCEAVPVAST
jgi:hypothetical protein